MLTVHGGSRIVYTAWIHLQCSQSSIDLCQICILTPSDVSRHSRFWPRAAHVVVFCCVRTALRGSYVFWACGQVGNGYVDPWFRRYALHCNVPSTSVGVTLQSLTRSMEDWLHWRWLHAAYDINAQCWVNCMTLKVSLYSNSIVQRRGGWIRMYMSAALTPCTVIVISWSWFRFACNMQTIGTIATVLDSWDQSAIPNDPYRISIWYRIGYTKRPYRYINKSWPLPHCVQPKTTRSGSLRRNSGPCTGLNM